LYCRRYSVRVESRKIGEGRGEKKVQTNLNIYIVMKRTMFTNRLEGRERSSSGLGAEWGKSLS